MKKTPESESLLSALFLIIIILLISGLATARKAKKYNRITQASLRQTPFNPRQVPLQPVMVYPAFAQPRTSTPPAGQNFSQGSGWSNPIAQPIPVINSIPIQQPMPVILPAVNPSAPPTSVTGSWRTSSEFKMLPFQEAHWQGLELIPLIPALARILGIPVSAKGVIVDDVTPPADLQGFQAGDLITSVGQVPTPTLVSFINATDRVRDRRRAEIRLIRNGKQTELLLTSARKRLGIANGEAAPMIKAGSRSPHNYQGPCTECHRIGAKGQLAMDQGDLLGKTAPPILADMKRPHRDRGECAACHQIKK